MGFEPDVPVFELHPRLRQDCIEIGRFPLCRLLLMNERRYPWFILVPQRSAVSEIFQLSAGDQQQLLRESSFLARTLAGEFAADKLNIASIGNLVPQLHVHHIVRYHGDAAWPAPVWGRFEPDPYQADELSALKHRLRIALSDAPGPELAWTAE